MIHVLIVESHEIFRIGLRLLLDREKDIHVAADVANSQEAFELLQKGKMGLLLMDVDMPDKSGLDFLGKAKTHFPKLPILVLTAHPDDTYALRALRAGASGYLTKNASRLELITAIHKVASGAKYCSEHVADLLLDSFSRNDRFPHNNLSDREYQVLYLIAKGKSVRQIAEKLSLGIATINTYRASLQRKLGVHSTAALIIYAFRHKLVD